VRRPQNVMFDLLFATVVKGFYQYLVIYNLSIAGATQSKWDQELMAQMYVFVYA